MTKCVFSWLVGLCLFLSPMLLNAQCVITTVSSLDGSNPIVTCEGDGNADVVNFNNSGAAGSSYAYAITDANFNILLIVTDDSFDFEGAGIGNCQVWGFSYDGEITAMAGDFVFSTQFATNCWLISQNAIQVSRTSVQGGFISLTNGNPEGFVCVGDGFPDILSFSSTGDGDISYVVTDSNGTIISISNSPNVDFDGNGDGDFQVYAVSSTGNVNAMVGDNFNTVSFSDDCFQVSENFISVSGSTVDAGTISTDDGLGYVQIVDSMDTQTFTLVNTSTSSADYAYVLTDNTFNVLQILPSNVVNLSSYDAGKYFVWAYSYTGDIITEIGDSVFPYPFSSGCSEISITAVVIEKLFDGPGTGEPVCLADAGTLTIDIDPVMLVDGITTISATPNGDAVAPTDYETIFVLTNGGVILQTGATPSFDVTTAGDYVIHTLIAEASDNMDANFLDLSGVVPGTTTAADVLPAIMAVCADLDLNGAPVTVNEGMVDPCDDLALNGGIVTITGGSTDSTIVIDGNANIITFETDVDTVGQDFNFTFVITDNNGIILGVPMGNSVDFNPAGLGVCYVWGLTYTGDITAMVGDDAAAVALTDGCFDLSDMFVTVNRIEANDPCDDLALNGGIVTITGGSTDSTIVIDGNANIITFETDVDTIGQDFNFTFVITDNNGIILGVPMGNSVDFNPAGLGVCYVWGLTYTGDITAMVGDDAAAVALTDGCFDLSDMFVTVNRIEANDPCDDLALNGGIVTITGGSTDSTIVIDGNANIITFETDVDTVGQDFNFTFVITDNNGIILGVPMGNSVDFNPAGLGVCYVWGLTYTGDITAMVGDDAAAVALTDGCFDLSDMFVTVNRIEANDPCDDLALNGGIVTITGGSTDSTIVIDGNANIITFETDVDTIGQDFNFTFVITDNNGIILGVPMGNSVDFNPAGLGVCYVWGLTYTGDITAMVGDDAAAVALTDGCFDLSDMFVTVNRIEANDPCDDLALNGGIVTITGGSTDSTIVIDGNANIITFETDVDTIGQDFNFTFVITDNNGIILGVPMGNSVDFNPAGLGVCYVWGLTYTGDITAMVGDDAAAVALTDGCFDLSDMFVTVNRIEANDPCDDLALNGGIVTITGGSTDSTIVIDGNANIITFETDVDTVGQDFNFTFVITDNNGIILGVPMGNSVDFNPAGLGVCYVWGLTYTGDITAMVGDDAAAVALTDGCFDLSDMFVTVNRIEANDPCDDLALNGGIVTITGGSTDSTIVIDGNANIITFETDVDTIGQDFNFTFVITDNNGIILGVPMGNSVDFNPAGLGVCYVWGLTYTGDITAMVGDDAAAVALTDGCFDLSDMFVTVNRIEANDPCDDLALNGGIVTITGGSTDSTIVIDGNANIITFETDVDTVGQDFNFTFVITDNNGIILGVPMGNSVDFNPAGLGVCYVWGLTYTGDITAMVGDDAAAVALTDGCFDLSDMFVTVNRIENAPNILPTGTGAVTTKFSVYPNPASDNLNLVWEQSKNAASTEVTINLVDLQGRVISSRQENVTAGQNIFQMEVTELNTGLYTIIIANKDAVKTQRFLKE